MSSLDHASKELLLAHELILALTSRVYTGVDSAEEGKAVKTLLLAMGVRPLVYVHNEISKYLGSDDRLDPSAADWSISGFPTQFRFQQSSVDRLLVVRGWLSDPYLHDSRPEYRGAGRMNLIKAQEVILSVIELVCEPN